MWDGPTRGFVYQMGPVDWWPGWSFLDETVAQHGGDAATQASVRVQLERIRENAYVQFRDRTYWEGEPETIEPGPVFAGLPPGDGDADGDVMFAIKQSNNGSVFVWSPYELPWLAQYAV